MSLSLLRVDEVAPQPWANGGGLTRELLAWPTPADWWLRVSVADIERDGPFSAYPDVDRWFGVLEGQGVQLVWRHAERRLHAGHSLLHFDGALAPDCRLLGDTTRDLNVMHRRGQGRVMVQRALPGSRPPDGFGRFALFALSPATLRDKHRTVVAAPAWSLVWGDRVDASLAIDAGSRAWWIAFDDNAAPR